MQFKYHIIKFNEETGDCSLDSGELEAATLEVARHYLPDTASLHEATELLLIWNDHSNIVSQHFVVYRSQWWTPEEMAQI